MPECHIPGLNRSIKTYARILITVCSLAATMAYSLPDDRDKPIHITADKALRNEVDGVTVYSGNVELVQGSMELEADKLTIYHKVETADEIIAIGSPAKMRQQPELDKEIVHAQAKVITYFKNEDRVHLQTEARIEKEGAVVDSDAIDYFIAKQLITAQADQTKENNKVVVVIEPNNTKARPETPATKADAGTPINVTLDNSISGATQSE